MDGPDLIWRGEKKDNPRPGQSKTCVVWPAWRAPLPPRSDKNVIRHTFCHVAQGHWPPEGAWAHLNEQSNWVAQPTVPGGTAEGKDDEDELLSSSIVSYLGLVGCTVLTPNECINWFLLRPVTRFSTILFFIIIFVHTTLEWW